MQLLFHILDNIISYLKIKVISSYPIDKVLLSHRYVEIRMYKLFVLLLTSIYSDFVIADYDLNSKFLSNLATRKLSVKRL
jgi:hypothetical protein